LFIGFITSLVVSLDAIASIVVSGLPEGLLLLATMLREPQHDRLDGSAFRDVGLAFSNIALTAYYFWFHIF
jgi:hypothetical protein